jgi:hypothetical protein
MAEGRETILIVTGDESFGLTLEKHLGQTDTTQSSSRRFKT